MNTKDFDKIYETFKEVHRGILYFELPYLKEIRKGDLEIIVDLDLPTRSIEKRDLRKIYQNIPIKYNSVYEYGKVISLEEWQKEKKRKELINYIIKNTKSW